MQSYNNIKDYKQLKKQLKLLEGLSKSPAAHRPRLERLLAELEARSGLKSSEELRNKLEKHKRKREENEKRKAEISEEAALRLWFLRPLLSHLDRATKIAALGDPLVGITGLQEQVVLHVPGNWTSRDEMLHIFRQFFYFKGQGKGSIGSYQLEQKFLELVKISQKLPFSLPGMSDLPVLHYSVDKLWSDIINNNQPVTVVSGLCPLSIIADELAFETRDGKLFRPELGFEPLKVTNDHIKGHTDLGTLRFPPRPILSDYIELVRTFLLANMLADLLGSDAVKVKLWLPVYEYYLALTQETFSELINSNIISPEQIEAPLKDLARRYESLAGAVRKELGYNGELTVEITDERSSKAQREELEALLKAPLEDIVNKNVSFIYGLYKGTELRRNLFALLAFKHIMPLLDGPQPNILHVENSYEIWPSALASRWAEEWAGRALDGCGERKQIFAWLCTPSVPSPSLKYMRALNAPYQHKFYLAAEAGQFQAQLDALRPKYLRLLAVLMTGIEPSDDISMIRDEIELKMIGLNKTIRL